MDDYTVRPILRIGSRGVLHPSVILVYRLATIQAFGRIALFDPDSKLCVCGFGYIQDENRFPIDLCFFSLEHFSLSFTILPHNRVSLSQNNCRCFSSFHLSKKNRHPCVRLAIQMAVCGITQTGYNTNSLSPLLTQRFGVRADWRLQPPFGSSLLYSIFPNSPCTSLFATLRAFSHVVKSSRTTLLNDFPSLNARILAFCFIFFGNRIRVSASRIPVEVSVPIMLYRLLYAPLYRICQEVNRARG